MVFHPDRSDFVQMYNSKHLLRGQLWAWNWLRDAGYSVDVHTDLDLHAGLPELADYRAVILASHMEYLSTNTMNAVTDYLAGGGNLLYLGANTFYDVVDISSDLRSLTTHGTAGTGRTHLFRQLGRPESELLGVAFPWSAADGDTGNCQSRLPYRVVDPAHRFFKGTGVVDNQKIGARGWTIAEGSTDLTGGRASGWECDQRNTTAPDSSPMPLPAGVELLATGMNDGSPGNPAADMVTYRHDGGGLVFSVGSMTFVGSLMIDRVLQQVVRNVLTECLT